MTSHLVIPDTQSKPGVPNDHFRWIGKYILDRKPDVVIHLGDNWDMPSLSSYDRGKKDMEGRRYEDDVARGNADFALLTAPLRQYQRQTKAKQVYAPRNVFLFGNHEERIARAVNDNAQLEGAIGLDDLNTDGWETHGFLEPVTIDGVVYAHYFYNPMTGRPYSGQNIDTRLKTIGHSFTMGHQQGLKWGTRGTVQGRHNGLVAGSCYLHDEKYLGPQGNVDWRGVIVKHQVKDGDYDPMFVSLEYLCQKYEGVSLEEFMTETYGKGGK